MSNDCNVDVPVMLKSCKALTLLYGFDEAGQILVDEVDWVGGGLEV